MLNIEKQINKQKEYTRQALAAVARVVGERVVADGLLVIRVDRDGRGLALAVAVDDVHVAGQLALKK